MSKLQEINTEAAIDASNALSKLIDKPVSVGICTAEVKKVEELSPIISPEEVVAGIYLPVKGEIIGAALLIFPKETAFTLCDLLVGREPGTTRKLTELDRSALKETGNIICGTYFAVLANTLRIKLIEQVPNFSFDMFGAITTQIITEFAQNAEEALVIELEFLFKPATLKGYLLLLLNLDKLRPMLRGGGLREPFMEYVQ